MRRHAALLIGALLVWGVGCTTGISLSGLSNHASAQDPNHVLRHTDGSGGPGAEIELQVLTDNTGANIDGWSFGVCLDPSEVEVISVEPGNVVQGFNGGQGPFFSSVELLSDGWTAGLVVN